MIRGLRPVFEKAHNIAIRDEAIVAAVKLSHRYISGRQLPDKAVDLLDTATARVKINLDAKPEELVDMEVALASQNREREALERDRASGFTIDEETYDALVKRIASRRGEAGRHAARWRRSATPCAPCARRGRRCWRRSPARTPPRRGRSSTRRWPRTRA
jgi:type VI secretion system protein VasG